jgi:hypothetical protein
MTAPSLARRIADPRSWENGVLSSAAIGALTLVDPARLSPGQRLLHRGALAGLAGVAALLEVRAAPSYAWQDPVARAGLPVGAAGLMLGMAEVNELWDRRLHRYLHRRGVRQPRLLVAAAAAAFSLTAFAVGRGAEVGPELEVEKPTLQGVPDEIRELVLGMLRDEENYSSRELQAQLDGAQARVWPAELGFASVIELTVTDDVPLAVPHTFTFPVKARLTGHRGEPLQVLLNVEDGLLSTLVLDRVPQAEGGEAGSGEGLSGGGVSGGGLSGGSVDARSVSGDGLSGGGEVGGGEEAQGVSGRGVGRGGEGEGGRGMSGGGGGEGEDARGVSGRGVSRGGEGEDELVDLTEQRWPKLDELTLVRDSHQRRR